MIFFKETKLHKA